MIPTFHGTPLTRPLEWDRYHVISIEYSLYYIDSSDLWSIFRKAGLHGWIASDCPILYLKLPMRNYHCLALECIRFEYGSLKLMQCTMVHIHNNVVDWRELIFLLLHVYRNFTVILNPF